MIERKHNGLVKVITGLRRVGKSYLLFNLFKRHLLDSGVKPSHIVEIALDQGKFESLQNPIRLAAYLREHVKGRGQFYVLIDEIQLSLKVRKPGLKTEDVAPEDRRNLYVTFYDVLNEIDFVVNLGVKKVYVQSAFRMPDEEKRAQETAAFRRSGDFFRKIVVTSGTRRPLADENGIVYVGVIPFLLDQTLLEGNSL